MHMCVRKQYLAYDNLQGQYTIKHQIKVNQSKPTLSIYLSIYLIFHLFISPSVPSFFPC